MQRSDLPIIELDTIDSTNNYAMQLIDADKAQPGLTVVAQSQRGGKGQRGRVWVDEPGQSLLMSLIADPKHTLTDQFVFSAAVAVAIANVLKELTSLPGIHIKWPNDIIINDKKAGGILIENVLRGSRWTHSVIGLGLNVRQASFPAELPNATSLKIATGRDTDMTDLCDALRTGIFEAVSHPPASATTMQAYNRYLYKKSRQQRFSDASGTWEGIIVEAQQDGALLVQKADGSVTPYRHGELVWEW